MSIAALGVARCSSPIVSPPPISQGYLSPGGLMSENQWGRLLLWGVFTTDVTDTGVRVVDSAETV